MNRVVEFLTKPWLVALMVALFLYGMLRRFV